MKFFILCIFCIGLVGCLNRKPREINPLSDTGVTPPAEPTDPSPEDEPSTPTDTTGTVTKVEGTADGLAEGGVPDEVRSPIDVSAGSVAEAGSEAEATERDMPTTALAMAPLAEVTAPVADLGPDREPLSVGGLEEPIEPIDESAIATGTADGPAEEDSIAVAGIGATDLTAGGSTPTTAMAEDTADGLTMADKTGTADPVTEADPADAAQATVSTTPAEEKLKKELLAKPPLVSDLEALLSLHPRIPLFDSMSLKFSYYESWWPLVVEEDTNQVIKTLRIGYQCRDTRKSKEHGKWAYLLNEYYQLEEPDQPLCTLEKLAPSEIHPNRWRDGDDYKEYSKPIMESHEDILACREKVTEIVEEAIEYMRSQGAKYTICVSPMRGLKLNGDFVKFP